MDLKNLDDNYRFTKIVATIGPSTEEYENLKAVIEAGVNVCRLNFSHGSHEDHKKRFDNIKRIEKESELNPFDEEQLQKVVNRIHIMSEEQNKAASLFKK